MSLSKVLEPWGTFHPSLWEPRGPKLTWWESLCQISVTSCPSLSYKCSFEMTRHLFSPNDLLQYPDSFILLCFKPPNKWGISNVKWRCGLAIQSGSFQLVSSRKDCNLWVQMQALLSSWDCHKEGRTKKYKHVTVVKEIFQMENKPTQGQRGFNLMNYPHEHWADAFNKVPFPWSISSILLEVKCNPL